MRHQALSAEPGAGEATSFIACLEKSQGTHRAMTREVYREVALPGEALSFTERAFRSQGGQAGAAVPAEGLSRERMRLVQRALMARGYASGISGRFDEATRSSLASFQRANALPESGDLDRTTIDALGFDVSQVRPVRGSDRR